MEEGKGFSSIQLGLAENTSRWAFLHSYSLLKLPKSQIRKYMGLAYKIR